MWARRIGLSLGIALAAGCGGEVEETNGTASGSSGTDGSDGQTGSGAGPATDGPVSSGGTSDGPGGDDDDGGSTGTTGGSDDDGDDTGDPPGPSAVGCPPLDPPEGPTVTIGPGDDFAGTIADAPSGTTILLEDGTYDLGGSSYIVFETAGVTLRSASGNAEAVVLDGAYEIGSLLNVAADDITIAEITLQRPMWHPIHVTGGADGTTTLNTMIYGVRIFDPGQQAIKINPSGGGQYADDGTVACSSIVMTSQGRANVTDCYTGGIDAHAAWGWEVRDNYFEGFWCEQGLSEHAVHFWSGSRDTLVERNVIVDCARGVGFGLGANGNGNSRPYDDDPCPDADFVGHFDGVIRNNVILGTDPAMFASALGFDSGVALEQACGAVVAHNTVVATQPPFVSMEYRFPNTRATISNNLVTHDIVQRDSGQATLEGNMEGADVSHFVDLDDADLHLVPGSSAVDAGVPLSAGVAVEDMDGDLRDATPDVGADELVQ